MIALHRNATKLHTLFYLKEIERDFKTKILEII